jgi:hypothetical protein
MRRRAWLAAALAALAGTAAAAPAAGSHARVIANVTVGPGSCGVWGAYGAVWGTSYSLGTLTRIDPRHDRPSE